MLIKIDNIDVNYEQIGNKQKETLIFLHGWGQNIEMMKPIAVPFVDDFNIFIIDIPGFGNSEEPKNAYTVYDYVELLNKFIKKQKIDNPILIGHSFGGKISLLYASKYKVKKLILFGSPFQKEIKRETLKLKTLKTLKKIPLLNKLESFAKKHIGSRDYRSASLIMRKILVNTVNLDIKEEVKNIKCPTILIWGSNDSEVDVNQAHLLEELITDSALIIYEGRTHYAYLEELNKTINIISSFIKN